MWESLKKLVNSENFKIGAYFVFVLYYAYKSSVKDEENELRQYELEYYRKKLQYENN